MDLDNPITDATLLYSTLIGNYMFNPENVTLLKDPSRADIIMKLDELSYQLTRNDNLLIFYAGHGHWDSEKETGFWLPVDAESFSIRSSRYATPKILALTFQPSPRDSLKQRRHFPDLKS